MNPAVDEYLAIGCGRCSLVKTPECKVHFWTEPLKLLRDIALNTELKEERKWGVPCYTYNGKNVLIISAFKEYCSMSFFKGSLLKDTFRILEKPGPNSQASRLIKFTDTQGVIKLEQEIRTYINEAIAIEKSGKSVDFKAKDELEYPEELVAKFTEQPDLKTAFENLTPGRKRGYVLHFTQPKQSKTRVARIEKLIPKIMEGKGFFDR